MASYGTLTITASPGVADAGQAIRLTIAVRDQAGAPVDPATLTLTITLPDGTTTPVTIVTLTKDSAGNYHYDYLPPAQVGGFTAGAVATVPNAADDTAFEVSASNAAKAPLVDLQQVRDYLNFDDADVADDAEISRFIAAATEVAEEIYGGPIAPTIITEFHDGGVPSIVLRARSVVSVQSVVEYINQVPFPLTAQPLGGSSFGYYGYTLDGLTITRRSTGSVIPFTHGKRNIAVTYTAGFANIPQRMKQGIAEIVRHWQRWGQEASAPPPNADDAFTMTSMGYAIPNRVVQLIAPQLLTPGIA